MRGKVLLITLGTPLGGKPRPWEHFKVPALMVNAYEMIKENWLRQKVREKGGLHNVLDFDGIVLLDSGGYQSMIHGIEVNLKLLKEIFEMSKADYLFSLDYPCSLIKNNKIKTQLTISNYHELSQIIKEVIPIVHPPLRRALEEYEAYEKQSPECIGIGGLVPMMLKFSKRGKQAIDLIAEIRSRHRGSIHVMGLGAPTVIPILEALHCTSTDSASWRIKAAHGKIMLPHGGERYVSNRGAKFGVISLSEEEESTIEKLNCPILKEYGWEGLEKSFRIRALFNAWITLYPPHEGDQLNGPFSKLLDYAQGIAGKKGLAI